MTNQLYLLPTVLSEGTTEKVLPPQVVELIAQIPVFFVENVRTARRFISSLKLGVVISDIQFVELTKETPELDTKNQLANLTGNVGVLSEAGCPGIADPGSVVVKWAHILGWKVIPMVGPSSILLGLMGSGFNGQSFTFHGYLPIDSNALAKKMKSIISEVQSKNETQIWIETPYRNHAMLETICKVTPPTMRLCIGYDLTGVDEFIWTGTIAQWQKKQIHFHKIPAIFLLGQ